MFGYGKTIRRLRDESNAVVIPPLHGYDLYVNFNKCKQKYSRKVAHVLKFAACFVLVTVLFGIAVIPGNVIPRQSNTSANVQGGSAAVTHSFTLAAYAAETGTASTAADPAATAQNVDEASKTVLKPDVKVQLPSGKFANDQLCLINGDWVDSSGVKHYAKYTFSPKTFFNCEGDNIASVTYTSTHGHISFFDRDLADNLYLDGESYICNLAVPNSVPAGSSKEQIDETFLNLINSRKLDSYNDKYIDFGNGNTVKLKLCTDQNGNVIASGLSFGSDGLTFGSDALDQLPQNGSNVIAKANGDVTWTPSIDIWNTVDTSPNFTGYASLPPDTVTVTAKFTDGQALTKTVIISYNADGSISATLQGN